jgi:ribosomal protein S18 acetylase RimI-like enzyme
LEFASLTEADAEDAVAFIEEGTATAWPLRSWVNSGMRGIVVKDSGGIVGILPLRPREVTILGEVMTAYYCTAVRVTESYRNSGLGSEMLRIAVSKFCNPTAFVCVVRSDPQSLAFNWYRKNGFHVVAEVSSHDINGDFCAENPHDLRTSRLETVEQSVLTGINEVLARAKVWTGVVGRNRSVELWRCDLQFHYYSNLYRDAELFICDGESGTLVGLVASTEMQSQPRIDILDFEYTDTQSFLSLANSVVGHYSARHGIPVRWNLGVVEGRKLGVESSWVERWRTNLMVHLHESLDPGRVELLRTHGWRYRQLEFV